MFKIISIITDFEDVKIKEGTNLNVTHGMYNISNGVLEIKTMDDCEITIVKGHYDLLEIKTNCGDYMINLENSYFDKVKIESECGDVEISTNYKNISFKSECGDLISHKKPVIKNQRSKTAKVIIKAKSNNTPSCSPIQKRVKVERYE